MTGSLPPELCVVAWSFGAVVVTAVVTNAVVAICVVFVPAVAVGAVGTPVSAGEASGAFSARSLTRLVTSLCGIATTLLGVAVPAVVVIFRYPLPARRD